MARHKKPPKQDDEADSMPVAPEIVSQLMEQAKAHAAPTQSPDMFTSPDVLKVVQVLAPSMAPPLKPGGKPRLREPMLMLSWSRSRGQWQAMISDRVLKYRITIYLESLDSLIEQVGRMLGEGEYEAREMYD